MTTTRDVVKKETSRYVSPFVEMERWFDEMWKKPFSLLGTSLLPELKTSRGFDISPSVDIYEEGKEVVLKADIPGVGKEDLDVNLKDNLLTITGQKKKEDKVEKDNYFRYERSHGSFTRRFQLPEGIDTDSIKANYKDGVLELRMAKTKETHKKTKKISIK
jgi:HSP20 family protein